MSADEPKDAVDLASPALLGALLWDPRRLDDVVHWLEPEDFREPEHRAIYRTLVALRKRGEPIDVRSLPAVLTAGHHQNDYTFPRREPRAAVVLVRLLEVTPATPAPEAFQGERAHSEHAHYARLLLTDSVRQQVRAAGVALGQHAGEALAPDRVASIGERVERLERGLQAVTYRLTDLAARLNVELSPGAIGSPLRSNTSQHLGGVAISAVADELVDAGDLGELRGQERALLGACLVSGEVRAVTAATLYPADFVDINAAATWRIVVDLHRRGQPIDYVLVAAEVERRGGGAAGDRPGLGASELAQLAAIHRSTSAPTGWTVLEAAVRAALERVTATAHQSLQQAAADRTLTAAQVVGRAYTALVRGGGAVRRLGAETSNLRATKPFAPAPAPAPARTGLGGDGVLNPRPLGYRAAGAP